MSMLFGDLQTEVKFRATLAQGGTEFDTTVKNTLNTSLQTLSRVCPWKQLRRKTTLTSVAPYTTGTVTVSASSNSWAGSSTAWLTNAKVGDRIKMTGTGGSSTLFTIATVTSNTALTTVESNGTSAYTAGTYQILGREDYTLPLQVGRIGLIWHEAYGYPFALDFITDRSFYDLNLQLSSANVPTHYRLWTNDWVLEQPKEASVVTVSSSSSADTSITITVFGIVSGYPDSESIITNASNGTTAVAGSKSFTTVERIVKSASTTGRITVTANSANTTVAVIPAGANFDGAQYQHIQLYPLPDSAYTFHIQYYKDPARLVNSTDVHELGSEFDEALILLASARISMSQAIKDKAEMFFQSYKDELALLRRKNTDNLDWLPVLQRPGEPRTSRTIYNRLVNYNQIGPNYGPMSY